MKTAEEVLKSKLNPAIAIINNADYTFNKVLEAMEEYAKLYHEQKLNIASVVRPEVEGAREGELLGNGLPKGVSVSEWCLCTDGLCKQLRIGKCRGWLKY